MYQYQLPRSLTACDSRLKISDTQVHQNNAQQSLYQKIKNSHKEQHASDRTILRHILVNRILSMAVSPCGVFVVFGEKQSMQILNIPKNNLEPYLETSSNLKSLYFSPNGLYLLCGYQKFIEIMNFKQKTLNSTIPMSFEKSYTAIFTTDGNFVAYPERKSIIFWSFLNKKEEFRLNEHESAVMSIACSADGRFIISGSSDGSIILWNYETRRKEFKLFSKQKQISHVKISNNGMYAASVFKLTVTVWNLDLRSEVFSLKFEEKIYSFPFSPDNQTLAIASRDNIKILNIKNKNIEKILNDNRFGSQINFTPDGKILIGSEICLWKICSVPKQIIYFHNLDDEDIKNVLVTDNRKYVGLTSYSQGLKIFNIEKEKIEFFFREIKQIIHYVQVSVDGNHLLTVGEGKLRIFNLKTNELIFRIYCIRTPFNKFYNISKDFSLLVVFSSFNRLTVWNIMKNYKIFEFETENRLNSVASFSNDCGYVAFGFEDGHIGVWNIDGKREEYSLIGVFRNIRGIYFTKDDQSIITVGHNGFQFMTSVCNIFSLIIESTIIGYRNIWINEYYIITDGLNMLNFWNIKGKFNEFSIYCESIPNKILYDGKRLSLFYRNNCDIFKIQEYNKIKCNYNSKLYVPISFSKNKKYAVSGNEKVLNLWDVDKEKEILSFKAHKNWIRTLCFSHDNKNILSGDDDGCLKIWDLNGKEIQCFKGHSSWVVTAAFSKDDRFVVSGSNDRIVLLWEVESNGKLKTFEVFEQAIQLLSFTSSGKFIVVQPVEGDLRVLKV